MSLESSFINTLFLTFIHNQDAIGYFLGIVVSVGLLLYKPNRFSAFLLVGFIFLLFGFEYNKHIIQPLEDQTLTSLGLKEDTGLYARGVAALLKRLLPLMFFFVGWGSILGALIANAIKADSKQKIIP
jgi:hypothetical protein